MTHFYEYSIVHQLWFTACAFAVGCSSDNGSGGSIGAGDTAGAPATITAPPLPDTKFGVTSGGATAAISAATPTTAAGGVAAGGVAAGGVAAGGSSARAGGAASGGATAGGTAAGGAAAGGSSARAGGAASGGVAMGGSSTRGVGGTQSGSVGGAVSGGTSGRTTSSTAVASIWVGAYNPSGLPTPSNGNHSAGSNCMSSACHGATASKAFEFGGTVYQANGTTPAPNVQVAVVDGSTKYFAYSATNGNFWVAGTAAINWTTAKIYLRSSSGELLKPVSTAGAACNSCHNSTLRIKAP